MVISLSERVKTLKPSATLALDARVRALKAEGKPVISLVAGEPDFDTPTPIKRAAMTAIQDGHTKYTEVAGILPLRKAVAAQLSKAHGVAYEPSQVMVSTGAKYAIYCALQALVGPRDEVLIPAPYWVSYPAMVSLTGATPKVVETQAANGFKLRPEELRRAVTRHSKILLLNTPHNPTGHVYSREELAALANIITKNNLIVIADEIYRSLTYGVPHVSLVSLSKELYDRTILVDGVSKAYAMTGWRLGYAAGPVEVIKAMTALQSQSTSNPTSITQYAALAALTQSQQPVAAMRKAFKARRDLVLRKLSKIPTLRVVPPQGAFYVFVNVTDYHPSSQVVAQRLLDEAMVATVPGIEFGAEGYLRISYATSDANLREALTRLAAFFAHAR